MKIKIDNSIHLIFYGLLLLNISCITNDKQEIKGQNILEKKEPDVHFIKKDHDFGMIKIDTTLTAHFPFYNKGTDILIIKNINPDCGCTNYTLSNDTLNPGDSAYIDLEFNTHNKFGMTKIHTIVKANTKEELYILTIKTNVISD